MQEYCSFLDHEGDVRDLLATFGTNLWRKKITGDLDSERLLTRHLLIYSTGCPVGKQLKALLAASALLLLTRGPREVAPASPAAFDLWANASR